MKEIATKACRRCGVDKVLTEFYLRENGGRDTRCRTCDRTYSYARYHRCDWQTATRAVAERDAAMAMERKGKKRCDLCQESLPLDLFRHKHLPNCKPFRINVCEKCFPAYRQASSRKSRRKYPFRQVLKDAKNRAAKRGLPFSLTEDYLRELHESTGGRCALTGIEMTRRAGGRPGPWSASLDRIDPAKGYVAGNVRWIVWSMNIALHNWGEEKFRRLAMAYLKHDQQAHLA